MMTMMKKVTANDLGFRSQSMLARHIGMTIGTVTRRLSDPQGLRFTRHTENVEFWEKVQLAAASNGVYFDILPIITHTKQLDDDAGVTSLDILFNEERHADTNEYYLLAQTLLTIGDKMLTPREALVLGNYIDGRTASEDCITFNVGRERIRQIRMLSYRKLRSRLKLTGISDALVANWW